MSDDWPDFPVILGYGSCQTLAPTEKPRKRKKRRIGFHLPPKPKR